MNDGQDVYVVDTSALMDWHDRFYPSDTFPTLVDLIDTLIGQGRLLSVQLVHDEVQKMGSTNLQTWAKARVAIFEATKTSPCGGPFRRGTVPISQRSQCPVRRGRRLRHRPRKDSKCHRRDRRNARRNETKAASLHVHPRCLLSARDDKHQQSRNDAAREVETLESRVA